MSDDKQSEIEQLQAQADELGVQYDSRWGVRKMREAVNAALEAAPQEPQEPQQAGGLRNDTKGPFVVGTQVAGPGKTVRLTAADRDNPKTMKKVKHAIKTGALVEV